MSDRTDALGELFLLGVRRPLESADLDRLRRVRPSGVIVFRPMASSVNEWLDAIDRIWSVLEAEGVAPIVSIDEEGGFVSQLPTPLRAFPLPAALARGGTEEDARLLARAQGRRLRALGVSLDYVPCVDVNSEPRNPVIGTRAYGVTADVVMRYADATARGFDDTGVAWCAKHFPGHGATVVDSHRGVPRVRRSRAEWEAVDAAPFRAAIAAGAPLVMSAHVIVDALDAQTPATFSRAAIAGTLRDAWGFGGVIVTDDLAMGGAAAIGSPGARARGALAAGCDLLLFAMNPEDAEDALRAVRADRALGAEVDASLARVRALRARYARRASGAPVDDPDAHVLAQRIARAAVRLSGAPLSRLSQVFFAGDEASDALGARLAERGVRIDGSGGTDAASTLVAVIAARTEPSAAQRAALARAHDHRGCAVIVLTRNAHILDAAALRPHITVIDTADDSPYAIDAVADLLAHGREGAFA